VQERFHRTRRVFQEAVVNLKRNQKKKKRNRKRKEKRKEKREEKEKIWETWRIHR